VLPDNLLAILKNEHPRLHASGAREAIVNTDKDQKT
jgi:hypothetical protein